MACAPIPLAGAAQNTGTNMRLPMAERNPRMKSASSSVPASKYFSIKSSSPSAAASISFLRAVVDFIHHVGGDIGHLAFRPVQVLAADQVDYTGEVRIANRPATSTARYPMERLVQVAHHLGEIRIFAIHPRDHHRARSLGRRRRPAWPVRCRPRCRRRRRRRSRPRSATRMVLCISPAKSGKPGVSSRLIL